MKTSESYKQPGKDNLSKDELPDRSMIPIEKCRAIMNRGGLHYTDDELIIMRNFLYRLAGIMTSCYDRMKANEAKVISINKSNEHDKTESIPLRSCEYGRTG